jgi:hypothetical protein
MNMRLSILLVCCATAGCATISAGHAVYALIRGVTLSGVVAIAMLAGCSSVGSVGKIETSTSKFSGGSVRALTGMYVSREGDNKTLVEVNTFRTPGGGLGILLSVRGVNNSWFWLKCRRLAVRVDGQIYDLEEVEHDGDVSVGGSTVMYFESLSARVPEDVVTKMLATEDVVFGVCGEALEMSTAQIVQLHHAIR